MLLIQALNRCHLFYIEIANSQIKFYLCGEVEIEHFTTK